LRSGITVLDPNPPHARCPCEGVVGRVRPPARLLRRAGRRPWKRAGPLSRGTQACFYLPPPRPPDCPKRPLRRPTLLADLATYSRTEATTALNQKYVFILRSRPTPTQQRAFELLEINQDLVPNSNHLACDKQNRAQWVIDLSKFVLDDGLVDGPPPVRRPYDLSLGASAAGQLRQRTHGTVSRTRAGHVWRDHRGFRRSPSAACASHPQRDRRSSPRR
jgi:hypothetical protein